MSSFVRIFMISFIFLLLQQRQSQAVPFPETTNHVDPENRQSQGAAGGFDEFFSGFLSGFTSALQGGVAGANSLFSGFGGAAENTFNGLLTAYNSTSQGLVQGASTLIGNTSRT